MYDENRIVQPLEQAGEYAVGNEIGKIVMSRDGAGPMGWYDVIHVFWGDDEEPGISMPAHHVTHWKPA